MTIEHAYLQFVNLVNRNEKAGFTLNLSAKEFKLLSGKECEIKVDGDDYSLSIKPMTYSIYKIKK